MIAGGKDGDSKSQASSSSSHHHHQHQQQQQQDPNSIPELSVPKLSFCADGQKVDKAKLAQTEFPVIEFDGDTFRILLVAFCEIRIIYAKPNRIVFFCT